MSFKDKVVLVTGASSGIGAAVAVAFVREGARVAAVGRNETKLAAVEQRCATHGTPPLVIIADVSKDDDVKRIIETTIDEYGKLDILVNNAGVVPLGSIMDGKLIQAYDKLIGTNLRAPMQLTSLACPHLIETKGNIVNVSSISGSCTPSPISMLPYHVSKAGLNNFTVGSALELSAHGVRVNAVCPGPVYTDILENSNFPSDFDHLKTFTALNRVSEPEEVADLILFLASDKAKGITGSCYTIDNGMLLKK